MADPHQPPKIAPMPMQGHAPTDEELAPIGLDEMEEAPAESKIRAFGVAGSHGPREYKRQPNANKTGACRMKTFHGKLSDQGMGFMDDQVNDWLEHHPEIEVKFVTSSVGQFEGKIREPALVLNIWY